MQWFREDYTSMFPKETSQTGIQLRTEMHDMLYGNVLCGKKPKGHWIVVRNFDRTQFSKYYNKVSNEGVHGPKHPFTDTLIRARTIPYSRKGMDDTFKVADINDNGHLYYVEWDVSAKHGDQLYELIWDDHSLTPDLSTVEYDIKYHVRRVIPKRCDYGNKAYNVIIVEQDDIRY